MTKLTTLEGNTTPIVTQVLPSSLKLRAIRKIFSIKNIAQGPTNHFQKLLMLNYLDLLLL